MDEQTQTPTEHLASVGALCQQYQMGYFSIIEALSSAGVKPKFILDLVPYYRWDDVAKALDEAPTIRGRSDA